MLLVYILDMKENFVSVAFQPMIAAGLFSTALTNMARKIERVIISVIVYRLILVICDLGYLYRSWG